MNTDKDLIIESTKGYQKRRILAEGTDQYEEIRIHVDYSSNLTSLKITFLINNRFGPR
jgi:hypothetical protein